MSAVQAVVLAAGLGQRLRPLTEQRPKALVPLFGVPLVDYVMARLAALSPLVRRVAVNLHHHPEAIEARLGDGRRWGLEISYSDEREAILGTGGALRRLAADLSAGPFVVMNADAFFPTPAAPLREALLAGDGRAATIVLACDPARPDLNLVATAPDGRVAAIQERPSPVDPTWPRWVFSGTHVLGPEIFAHLPAAGFACVVRDGYLPLLAAGARVVGLPMSYLPWHDLGTPENYLRAHMELFPRTEGQGAFIPGWCHEERAPGVFVHPTARVASGAHLEGPAFVDAGARVESGATLGPFAVLGRGAVLARGARLTHSVSWEDQEITGDFDRAILAFGEPILTGQAAPG